MRKIKVTLGVDIGGTKTAFGFVDQSGKIISEKTIPTNSKKSASTLFRELVKHTREMFSEISDRYEFAGVGIGAPNGNYFTGSVVNPPNMNWGSVNLVEAFRQYLEIPVFVTNDANATAIGEMLFGAARGMKNFIVLTLGTGLGSGIVVNGELVYGEDGFAGELGHTCVEPNGRQCGCGNRGCLEAYVSVTGIRRTVFSLLAELTADSPLRKIAFDDLDAREISRLARQGDPIALRAFEITGDILGMSMANAVAFSRPEAIILFGGLTGAGELLFTPTKKAFEKHLLDLFRGKVKVLQSGLENSNAAILGAAALAWTELEKRR